MFKLNTVINGDCFAIMANMPQHSIDCILTDPPYATTSCSCDVKIDLSILWERIKRVLKPNGIAIFTASQPFTSELVMSNREMFRYAIVWDKNKCGSPGLAKRRIMKTHEDILIFSHGKETYNPQMTLGEPYFRKRSGRTRVNNMKFGFANSTKDIINHGTLYPKSILRFSREFSAQQQMHPMQKPVTLFEYLIRTYTNLNDIVLDPFLGSRTTAVACIRERRRYVGIEIDEKYVKLALSRITKIKMLFKLP